MPKEFNAAVYDKKKLALLRKRAKRVEQLYTLAVHNASRIATQTSYKGEGDFFFDNYPSAKTEIDNMLQELAQALETNIKEGNDENWKLAASKNDAMVDALTKGTGIPKKNIKEWKHPNLEALQAFNERVVAGMGLSDRVWNLTKQFKAELELAMEVGIGEGKSAADLSRDVRKFLREPNKLFRRVRDKSGALRLSKAARAYHPGRGVYRSSYKNALRMTATENNIAYRTSDHERWKQMPFILGIDIHTSNNHPQEDICDDLEGRYPKDFKFTGWHPWCRCQATAALPSEAEFIKYGKAILNGSDQNFKFGDVQKEVPGKFKNWVTKNKTRIADATQMPYFLKDNPQYLEQAGYKIPTSQKDMFVDIKTGEDKPLTTLEKAKLRQAARTQGQIDDIKKRAAEREARHKMMRDTADAALTAGKSMPEVSTTALSKAIAEGNLDKMYELAQKVQAKIAKMEAAEQKLGDLIPDIHDWHKKFKIKELEAAHDAVQAKLDSWAGFDKAKLKKKLEFEVDYIENHPKYITDDVAKAAYSKKLDTVKFEIKADDLDKQLNDFYAYKTKSQAFQDLLGKAGYQLSQLTEENQATQIPIVEKKLKQLENKKNQLEAAKAKRKTKTKFTQDRKDKAVWDDGGGDPKKVGAKADKVLRPQASKTWKNAPQEQRDMMYEYTYHYADKNEPLELRAYDDYQTRKEWERKVNLMTDYIDNSPLPKDMWFQRGDYLGALEGRLKFVGGKMPKNFNDLVGMELQEGGFMSVGSGKWKGFNEDYGKDVIFNIFAPKGTKAAYVEPFSEYGSGVCSSSWNGIDKQTNFSQEFETIFQRGTRMRITKVNRKMYQGRTITYIDVEVIGQEKKALDYVPDDLIGW